jgi:hypothetical protein
MSTLAVHPLAKIHPVLGSDDRVHLAYELLVTNPSPMFVTLDKVEAIDPAGKVLANVSGDALAKMTTRYSGSNNLWAPGQSGIVFMDVTLAPGEPVPASVSARMTIPLGATYCHSGPSCENVQFFQVRPPSVERPQPLPIVPTHTVPFASNARAWMKSIDSDVFDVSLTMRRHVPPRSRTKMPRP